MPSRNIQYDTCIEDVFDQVRDHNAYDFSSKITDDILQQVMRERARRTRPLKFNINCICFSMRYPDKQVTLLLRRFQDDHSLRRLQIDTHAFNCHLNHISDSLCYGWELSGL